MSSHGTDVVVIMFRNYPELLPKLNTWLGTCARNYCDQDETEGYIAKKTKAYIDRQYDIADSRLNTRVLKEFLWYPEADYGEVASDLCCDYYTEFVEPADSHPKPGQRINPMTYDAHLNVLPPLDAPSAILRKYGCDRGFLVSEPAGEDSKGRFLFDAYGMNSAGECFYLGLSPESPTDPYGPPNRKRQSGGCAKRKTGAAKTKTASSQRKPARKPQAKVSTASRSPKGDNTKRRRR